MGQDIVVLEEKNNEYMFFLQLIIHLGIADPKFVPLIYKTLQLCGQMQYFNFEKYLLKDFLSGLPEYDYLAKYLNLEFFAINQQLYCQFQLVDTFYQQILNFDHVPQITLLIDNSGSTQSQNLLADLDFEVQKHIEPIKL